MRVRILFPVILLQICVLAACTTRDTRPSPRTDSPSETLLLHPGASQVLREAGIDPADIHCNSSMYWYSELDLYADKAADEIAGVLSVEFDAEKRKATSRILLGYLVRSMFEHLKPNNLGVMRLKGRFYESDDGRHPLLIFRSGVMTDADEPGSCLQSLLGAGRVRHVINLYGSSFPLHDYIKAEMQAAEAAGGTCHNEAESNRPWRELIEKPDQYEQNVKTAMQRIAELIKTQILHPGGKQPVGNILMFCGGGMHRTGMTYGILQRCINNEPSESIEETYKRHTAYRSEMEPGGYEALNLRFVREFDCSLLK